VALACSDAVKLRQAARQAGKAEGQARYEEIVLRADQEATIIVAQAREEAQNLEQKGRLRMEIAVCKAVAYVMGKALDGVDG
jgi:vacuolar-type H+-ATPase subunit E/Vma4